MHESPSSAQLLGAVITFLNDVATPALTGHAQFHARVSANALALVARELEQRQKTDERTTLLYRAILSQLPDQEPPNQEPNVIDPEAALCEAIRAGQIDCATPLLLTSLREVAIAQLLIDQPKYSGLKA